MTRITAAAAVVLLVALAGCQGEPDPCGEGGCPEPLGTARPGDGSATTAAPPPSQPSGTPAPPDRAKRGPVTWDVAIEGFAFKPASLTIQVGDTVRWTHEDGTVMHTVTADDGSFHSGDCPGAQCMTALANPVFEHAFDAEGSWAYHCEVHPSMKGTITVKQRWDARPDT